MLAKIVRAIDVNVPYEECGKFSQRRSFSKISKGIKIIFRGARKIKLKKALFDVQGLEGFLSRHI